MSSFRRVPCLGTLLVLVLGLSLSFLSLGGEAERRPTGDASAARKTSAEVNTGAIEALQRSRVPFVLLDARAEAGERIPGARPLAPEASAKEVTAVVRSQNALIVTYCGDETCPLRTRLADRLRSFGYPNVIEYPEGVAGWLRAGNGVETSSKEKRRRPEGSGRRPEGSGSRR